MENHFYQAIESEQYHPFGVNRKERKKRYIIDVVNYIHRNFESDISIKQLSEVSHKSQFHLSRVFKDEVGHTPYQYLMRYRVEKSKEKLVGSNLTVSEISHGVGFGSTSQYIAFFKRTFGVTPNSYRQNNGKKIASM